VSESAKVKVNSDQSYAETAYYDCTQVIACNLNPYSMLLSYFYHVPINLTRYSTNAVNMLESVLIGLRTDHY